MGAEAWESMLEAATTEIGLLVGMAAKLPDTCNWLVLVEAAGKVYTQVLVSGSACS
jgi:hypothetical protein